VTAVGLRIPVIREIQFKIGRGASESPLHLARAPMTVLVGPNGSGKSLVLRELIEYLERSGDNSRLRIVGRMIVDFPDAEEIHKMLEIRSLPDVPAALGQVVVMPLSPTGSGSQHVVPERDLIRAVENVRSEHGYEPSPTDGIWYLFCLFFRLFTVSLDAKNRFALVDERVMGDLQRLPDNHLTALFRDDAARSVVREILADAFGLYFVIDPTSGGMLRIRMSPRRPEDSGEEQALDHRARTFHAGAYDIAQLSDGVKAFTGIISFLASTDWRLVTIDEPEAFLHPPLARKLGRRMAELAFDRNATIVAATHSAEFLMGGIESGRAINIVRLTYEGGRGSARALGSSEISNLMRDPLLRSTNVLSALFHVGAVVCESDIDRALYQEINARLLAENDGGARDSIFLNAQNKQTIHRIIGPLRRMGIAAATIVDFDILKHSDLKQLLDACGVPPAVSHGLTVTRGDLEAYFRRSGLEMKQGGVSLLSGQEAAACRDLLERLAMYGIFVVPNGEIESWLGKLSVTGPKNEWLSRIFDRMGSDPVAPSYVRPERDDVWAFIRMVGMWIANPNRSGIPT
jgi:ABC-type cobalamin/Fe3+-siderophores transport system ATPase subunit